MNVKSAVRRVKSAPLFYLFAVLSLGSGLGLSGAAQAIVGTLGPKQILEGQSQFVDLITRAGSGGALDWKAPVSLAVYRGFAAENPEEAAASIGSVANVRIGSLERLAITEAVTPGYFDLLHVIPLHGRRLSDVDEQMPVVMVSAGLASRVHSELRLAVGEVITIGGTALQIVGIVPHEFHGLTAGRSGTDVWLPVTVAQRLSLAAEDPRAKQAAVIVRRDSRIPPAAILAGLRRADGPPSSAQATGALLLSHPESIPTGGVSVKQQTTLVGMASLVLLVGILNLANLSFARSLKREDDIRVKLSLGASRWRLIWDEASESLLVAACAGGLAAALVRIFSATWSTTVPIRQGQVVEVVPQFGTITAILLILLPAVSIIFIGLLPARRAVGLFRAKRRFGPIPTGSSLALARPARNLIRWQVAAVGVLIFIGVVTSGPLRRLATRDSGLVVEQLTIAEIDASAIGRRERADVLQHLRDIVSTIPAVSRVAVSAGMPFGIRAPLAHVRILGTPQETVSSGVTALAVAVDGEYFETTGIALVAGRAIATRDSQDGLPVVVISSSIAEALSDGGSVLGATLSIASNGNGSDRRLATVVGVTRDTDVVRFGSTNGGVVFTPASPTDLEFPTLTARGKASDELLGDIRRALAGTDFRLKLLGIGTGEQMLAPVRVTLRNASLLSLCFGGAALLLATVGLYGIMAQLVALRRREIGIRMALGATDSEVKRWILKTGFIPVFQGLVVSITIIGGGFAFLTATRGSGVQYLSDCLSAFAATTLVLGAASGAACWIPAKRAASIPPRELFTAP